ncbi:SDR family oxidoreductase [Mycolicibacterium neoaurum]|uniref:SDR family oxidoreductase n=1 Tax=Mycolicibacterium neoaurum TaxID=1795 RepID=UPI0026739C87|nr:SDR family oxidoreductase [Mycolicibacterium neoaurum]MDO3400681.1 SDR family oxidoreductase [Mycolicibacterium neoaurum]
MRITVVGATGLIGRRLVPMLSGRGHDVVAASRATGVDLLTGDGLADALTGADVVVDVINAPTPEDPAQQFFEQTSSNLAAAVGTSSAGHYVVLSIVGADVMARDAGYLRGKLAQEHAAAGSGVPWTVLRATQFHELAEPITESMIRDGEVRAPIAAIQTVDSAEVTAVLAGIATGTPADGVREVGGPQKMSFGEMARAVLRRQGRELPVVDDAAATYHGIPVDETTLVTGVGADLCATRLADWLARH